MEIVKSFTENNLHTEIIIKGSFDQPLFRASDIAEILDMANIRQIINNYDETEKVSILCQTSNGKHNVNFLTESGLYNVLFTSRKPIAKQFKKWVCSVIKEIRLKGKYELENKIKEQENELKEQENELKETKKELELKDEKLEEKESLLEKTKIEKLKEIEKAIIKQFPINTECIYIGTIENTNESKEKLIKFGHTNELSTRVTCHHKDYNNFVLIDAFRVQNKVEIENLIKSHIIIKKQIRTINVNDKNKTEIIAYDDSNFTIEKLIKIIKDIIQTKIYSIENFNKLLKKNE